MTGINENCDICRTDVPRNFFVVYLTINSVGVISSTLYKHLPCTNIYHLHTMRLLGIFKVISTELQLMFKVLFKSAFLDNQCLQAPSSTTIIPKLCIYTVHRITSKSNVHKHYLILINCSYSKEGNHYI